MGFFFLYGVKSATDKADVALGIRLYVYAGSNLHVVVHATRKRWVITSTRNCRKLVSLGGSSRWGLARLDALLLGQR